MSLSKCKFCNEIIFWLEVNGKNVAYEVTRGRPNNVKHISVCPHYIRMREMRDCPYCLLERGGQLLLIDLSKPVCKIHKQKGYHDTEALYVRKKDLERNLKSIEKRIEATKADGTFGGLNSYL